jgi:hypothetical protein
MTNINLNTNKCECNSHHTIADLYSEALPQVVVRQKWHKCYICKKFKTSTWIRYHEVSCEWNKNYKESLVK